MPATASTTDLTEAKPRGLSRLRLRDRINASTSSLASGNSSGGNDNDSGSNEIAPTDSATGKRSSMDAAVGKLKDRVAARRSSDARRGSNDSASATTGRERLSALVHGRSRRKSRQAEDANRISQALSARSGGSVEGLGLPGNASDSSLIAGSDQSSLMTDGYSDTERQPTRPKISPHQSHVGYLTLSSPQLHANAQAGPEPDTKADLATIASAPAASDPNLPSIVEPANTDSLAVQHNPERRSPSPGSRLRSAFVLNRKKSSGEGDSLNSGAGGGAGGLGLFRPRSRKNSLTSDEPGSAVQEQVASPAQSLDTRAAPAAAAQSAPQLVEERPQTPRKAGRNRINTNPSLPRTPPSLPGTPTTLVTPPTPTDPSHNLPTFAKAPTSNSSTGRESPTRGLSSVESIRHRRAQSQNLPSKLSNAIPAPLTPTLEEAKTPGGTLTQPTSASGFFTSVFSAAQKAADQLSSSINPIAPNQKSKGAVAASQVGEEGSDEIGVDASDKSAPEGGKQQPAVETLGKGNLSLSHLGISESSDVSPMNSVTDLPGQQDGQAQSNRAEQEAAARAVSTAYEKPIASAVSQAMGGRPLSIASQDRLTLAGDQTPPRGAPEADGLKRSGSVRSKLSGRRRRHRTSSATTGTANTIAAALKDSATGLSQVSSAAPGHRMTGFAVASNKRNKDFHQLFRSVPEDDYLIEDYSAALQRDILLHGRLYVSEGHICFSSNIFGWVTNLVISFDEVVSIEKKSTAVVFPNAIVIQTLQARNTFASFVARDSTYDLLIQIWKISHPNLKSSLNGVTLDKDNAGVSDKTEKTESVGSDDDSDDGSEDEVYDEDAEDDDIGSFTEPDGGRSIAESDVGDIPLSRKTSAQPLNAPAQTNGFVPKGLEGSDAVVTGAAAAQDFPGPPTHPPTECSDGAEHYDKPLTDTTIPAPLGKVYSMMFGPASGAFMKRWLVEDQKSRELELEDNKIGLDNDHKSFTFSYIKPLSAPVGPKQTKCITTNTLEAFDLEKAITINCSTQTPDVPSGNVFATKTKYCLMWGPGNSTRMIANCTIEWTGKSWLKGPIESGAREGQIQYVKDITAALKAAVTTKPPVKGTARKGKRKGKKEVFDATAANEERTAVVKEKEPNWGLFEPLRPILGPFTSILSPFITSQTIIAVLLTLLLYTWLFPAHSRHAPSTGVGFSEPERIAAYQELWRREESELWDWLEDRVGMANIQSARFGDGKVREMQTLLRDERMSEREVDEALRITEEKLGALKGAVERRKGEKAKGK